MAGISRISVGLGHLCRVALFAATLLACGSASAQLGRQLRGNRQIVSGGMIQRPEAVKTTLRDSLGRQIVTDTLGRTFLVDSLGARIAADAEDVHIALDSVSTAKYVEDLRYVTADSLARIPRSMRQMLPDSIREVIFGNVPLPVDSLAMDSLASDSMRLSEKERKRLERRENRKPFISDSMSLNKVCWASLVMPGFGQIYNKQYWKLPILYGTFGASLGMFIHQNNVYRPLKKEFDLMTDKGLTRTPEMNALQTKMIKHNTMRQAFLFTTIASYLYFIGDAAVCYATNDVSGVKRATTLSTICPGAGQVYNKSYWRVPLVVGGFATTIYCIDWNSRGYQRFKKAYRLRADFDNNPDLYPDGSQDEFGGRYSASFLKNLRNSYRRNRDLCIIITAGLYILQIVDAHVDAHLKDYDISEDLSVELEPMFDYSYNPGLRSNSATLGMNLRFTF